MREILIIEDHADACAAMKDIVLQAFNSAFIYSVSTLQQARKKIEAMSFDLVVLDLGLPDGKGEDFIGEIIVTQPNAYVVISTIHDESERLLVALQNGAKGYLLKEQSADFLVAEFQGILKGKPPLAPAITRRLLEVVRNRQFEQSNDNLGNGKYQQHVAALVQPNLPSEKNYCNLLTAREQEILSLVGKGFNRPEIAGILSISKHTVASHLSKIYDKLGISNQSEAALTARELGLT